MAISTPEAKDNAGIYTFSWAAENIGIRIERITEDSKGVMTGEIQVYTGLPASDKHIHYARLNLSSSRERSSLVKTLTERVPNIDWYAALEQACILTITRHRQGEPVLEMGMEPDYTAPNYRLSPIIYEGEPTIIYGPGGTGKSYLALFIACMVQYGYQWLTWRALKGNVLILDWETSYAIYKRRTWAVKAGNEFKGAGLIQYRYCTQSLPADIAAIQKIVVERDIKLVIIDSCGYAAGGDPNEAECAIRYFSALRSLRISSLTIDHTSKGLDGGRSPFGSVYKTNAARSVFQLKKDQSPGENQYALGLYHEKVNEGMLLKPFGYKTAFVNNENGIATRVVFDSSDVMEHPKLNENADLKDKIMFLLKTNGKMSLTDLVTCTGENEATVKMTCYRYDEKKIKKIFVNLGDGKEWSLITGGPIE